MKRPIITKGKLNYSALPKTDMEIKRAIVNHFIQEIVVTNEQVIITYNFIDNIPKSSRSASHFADLFHKYRACLKQPNRTANIEPSAPKAPSNWCFFCAMAELSPKGSRFSSFSPPAVA